MAAKQDLGNTAATVNRIPTSPTEFDVAEQDLTQAIKLNPDEAWIYATPPRMLP